MKYFAGFYPLFAVILFAFGGCSPFTKVYSEEEPGVNLHQYYSYKWLPNNGALPGDPIQYKVGDDVESKIRSAVDIQMQHCGYKVCDSGPDLLLHYHVVIKNRVYYQRDWECDDAPHEASQHAYCQRVRPVHFREGSLILDFMDAETGHQVWRGVAVGIIENLTPAEMNTRIEEAARKIFSKYPVKPQPQP